MKKAVLFMVFNRLDTMQESFSMIRQARPPRLYVACDGARAEKAGEANIVKAVREYILSAIDWDCEVKTLFQETNLGCGKAISTAITWFFKNEPDGIILEDDCVPDVTFFSFCETLLDEYKNDKRIWSISGHNSLGIYNAQESYVFGLAFDAWGWASWADRWLPYYEYNLTDCDKTALNMLSEYPNIKAFYSNLLSQVQSKIIDTWDIQWAYIILAQRGLCISPAKNLVSNIGYFGTHVNGEDPSAVLASAVYSLLEMKHPKTIAINNNFMYRLNRRRAYSIYSSISVALFNIVPLLKITYNTENLKIYLFKFIPLLGLCYTGKGKVYVYLFNFLTILKIRY